MRALALGFVLAVLLLAAAPAARALGPAQEVRAHALFRQIRCVVCQNESIDDSEADLAADLRRIVREQIATGRTDAEIRRFLTDRYGEFVLLKPRVSAANAVLWTAPFVIVLGGLGGFALRRRAPARVAGLTVQEEVRLEELTRVSAPGLHETTAAVTLPPDTGLTKGVGLG